RQQFWPVPRPAVYRRGFVPQYFSIVKPAQFSGEMPPAITCTKPAIDEPQDNYYPTQDDLDEMILFEESFAFPATPSELSMSDRCDLSDNDAMDDINVREYLQSGIVSDPDDYNDELEQLSPEPITDQWEETKELTDNHQTQEIDVEITILNQTKSTVEQEQTSEPLINEQEKQDSNETQNEQEEQSEELSTCMKEEPDQEPKDTNEPVTKIVEDVPEEKLCDIQEAKAPLPPTPHPDPPRVTFVDSITVTSYNAPETKEKKTEPTKPILKQPKTSPQPRMEVKPLGDALKKPKPRPFVERRVADIRPQVKPGIILKPEPPKVQEDKQEEKVVVEPQPLEEKLPEPEFVHAPGAYQMYQAMDLHQHELDKPKTKKIQSRSSQMPLPYTGISSQMPLPYTGISSQMPLPYTGISSQMPLPYTGISSQMPLPYTGISSQMPLPYTGISSQMPLPYTGISSQMPLPYTGISSHHQMMPESSSVMNAVIEDARHKKEGMKPWLQGRLALSKQTSRFELPMDVKVLESMTAMEYLTKYCIISTRRKALYKHVFQKVDKDWDGIIGFRELEKGLREIHVDSIDVKQVRNIVEMIGADDNTKFNLKQFSAIAAFSERILFSNFV
ncbi:hypothetical protein QZH41_016532, partial [Actinostola sp. cb2023]